MDERIAFMIHSFLLIGQSNMAGRGFLEEAHPIDTTSIKVLRNGRWQPMYRPVNPDRSFSGVNLAERFAELYAKKYQVEVGLIPCADGGTTLEQWAPGGLLFDHAVYQSRLAERTSTIAGVLWHQGEADCETHLYPTYRERLEQLLTAFRRELKLEDVPFLLGGLGDFLKDNAAMSFWNYPHINTALQEVAAAGERIGFVTAEGLPANSDNLHFSASALYEFGERYFEVFETLRDPNKVFEEKSHPDLAKRTAIELL